MSLNTFKLIVMLASDCERKILVVQGAVFFPPDFLFESNGRIKKETGQQNMSVYIVMWGDNATIMPGVHWRVEVKL